MYLLSIQGRYAPTFQLNEERELKLKHHIEALTKKHVLIVSSRFRSDLIYEDETNRLEAFLKTWCEQVGYPFSSAVKLKFFRSDEERISIDNFLNRLHLIRRIPAWYNGYIIQFQKKLKESPPNPLGWKINQCMEFFLDEIEKKRLAGDREAALKCVHEFITLKTLTSRHKNFN